MEKQIEKGYVLCSMAGDFGNILKFRYANTELPKSYIVYRKHLDEQVDEGIETMKSGGAEVICQSNWYIVFGIDSGNAVKIKSEALEKSKIDCLVFR